MRSHARFLAPFLVVAPLFLVAHCGGEEPVAQHPVPSTSTTVSMVPSASVEGTPSSEAPPPKTAKKPVVTTYQGIAVTDDYQWLEDSKDPDVQAWSDAENAYTRGILDAAPGRAALHDKMQKLLGASSPDWFDLRFEGKRLFALKEQPPKNQAFIVVLTDPSKPASEKTVLDPNVLDPSGKTAIDWYQPSHDGKLVAVSLSKGGSERGDLHIYEVDTGKERAGDVITHVQNGTAGGSVAWNADSSGLYYTRYPRPGETPKEDEEFFQQVWFHKLGTDANKDAYSIGKDFPRIAEVALSSSDDGKWTLAQVSNGDGGDHMFFVLAPGAKEWKQFAKYEDQVKHAQFGRDGALWLRSTNGAPKGKILRLDPKTPSIDKAKTIVAESDVVVQSFETTKSRLYVADLVGGPSDVRVFELAGKSKGTVPILAVSAVAQVVHLDGDDVLYRNESYVDPPAWFKFGPSTAAPPADAKSKNAQKVEAPVKTALATTAPADFSDVEVIRDTCTSKDNEKVPINVIRKKGLVLDGSHLALINGYGGYGVSRTPRFDVTRRVWLDQDGVFAVANIRGGGEFGEAWHLAGNLTKKQHVFDDFIACSRWLVDQKYTTPQHLSAIGGSNGGLLMGAAFTQAPDLYGAVVTLVGIYDMLRVELTANGAFNVTEFGTVKDKAQFDALYAYSPYHHVVDGTQYPAVLFMTGANDPRVDPWHSRKMVARMQASGTKKPILLRTSGDTGHGIGSPLSAIIDEETDIYSFLFSQLGRPYAPQK